MRRLALAIATLAAAGAATVFIWRWWTAPPAAQGAVLVAAVGIAPADADGAVAFAQPARAARWLASHPQALALLKLAAPTADRSLPRLRGFLAALAREAQGPLSLWWRGSELAAGASVRPGAAQALQRLTALEGLAFQANRDSAGAVVVAATGPTLIVPPGPPQLTASPGRFAAVGRCGGRLWYARAGRPSLDLVSGDPPALPDPGGVGKVATSDLAALLAAVLPLKGVPHAPANVLVDAAGWGAALPSTTLSPQLLRLLSLGGDVPAAVAPGARHWSGLLGDLWVLRGTNLAVASSPDLLRELPRDGITGESGLVRGPTLARLCMKAAEAADRIPGGRDQAAALRRAALLVEALRLTRWHLLPQGGHILLEW
jgi:hypothetical protein